MKDLGRFTNKYSLSKTLRFELVPEGKTSEHIEEKGIIGKDTKLAEDYQKVKKTIDEYHKDFIEKSLTGVELKGLDELFALYTLPPDKKKDDKYKKDYEKAQDKLRKEIVNAFKSSAGYANLNKKELIKDDLPEWIVQQGNPDLYFDENFRNFTTYFTGFNTNRGNMYSDEAKSTAIAYRLINENLPKFIDNMKVFERIGEVEEIRSEFARIKDELAAGLDISTLDELFKLEYYSKLLTQTGITAYNGVIGGKTTGTDDKKIQGLNEIINRYNQQHSDSKLPKFKVLYKQILSDRNSLSWLPEVFDSVPKLIEAVGKIYEEEFDENNKESAVCIIKGTFAEIGNCDLGKIYVDRAFVSTLSQWIFGSYQVLEDALGIDYDSDGDKKKKKKSQKEYYSFAEVQEVADKYPNICIIKFVTEKYNELLQNVKDAYGKADVLAKPETETLGTEDIEKIKALLDSMMNLLHLVKPLYRDPDFTLEKDEAFYSSFTPAYEKIKTLPKLYDKVRNFATKKPYSTEKVKLNFENNGSFLGGFVDSHTENSDNGTQYGGYLFRKKNGIGEYDYFIGFSADTKLFRSFNAVNDPCEYERLDYYQPKAQTIYGNLYKRTINNSSSDVIKYNEDKETFKELMLKLAEKANGGSLIDKAYDENNTPTGLLKLIKDNYPGIYDELLENPEYKAYDRAIVEALECAVRKIDKIYTEDVLNNFGSTLSEAQTSIDNLCKRKGFTYFAVSKKEFEQACSRDTKPLFLFRIANKDLNYAEAYLKGQRKSRGKDNLHTMYFKALMGGGQSVYDIGSGEVFFRKKNIIPNNTVHKANEPIKKKNPNLEGQESIFSYDIEKNRRYTLDKFQLHLSVVQNYTQTKDYKKLNDEVCTYIKGNSDVNIIGIDRGERHLLYLSMIDRDGNVVKDKKGEYIQYSLNTITGEYKDSNGNTVKFETPYHDLLDKKEEERDKARKSWGSIENIKELKNGYMSQVVHHIAKLMVEYNAIVVLEDLNGGFKNGRKKVEKQVYQNFEKALIEKLNYLVFKDYPEDEPGGLYNALQLTDKFTSFRNLTKQTGFLFYVPAWNTSKIDPVTGFVDFLKPRSGMTINESKNFFGKFDSIRYNSEKDWFEFAFNYKNFTTKAENTRQEWTVCTHGDLRYVYNRSLNNNRGGYEKINVTEELKDLFDKYGIEYLSGDLKQAITGQKSNPFFNELAKLLRVTLAMRYSCAEDKKDFILSPVADEKGEFYCSEGRKDGLPQDADANGAYNIARKGLMVVEQIDKAKNYKDWTTKISNKEWLEFVQK